MADPRFIYSQQTRAALKITKLYYKDKHYLICSEYYGPGPGVPAYISFPPTSTPKFRYDSLWKEIRGGDTHAGMIASARTGLLSGASQQHSLGRITIDEKDAIIDFLTRTATIRDFEPLMYMMDFKRVKRYATLLPANQHANSLYREYELVQVPGKYIEVLDLYNPDAF